MGEVYRARDTRLNRDVAIKVLPASFANDKDRLQRFEQEATATSALNHPNILTVYDIGSFEGSPFIVAELLEGEELRDLLNGGAIPQRKAIDYAQQIASGLAAAHSRAIVHRDLKPENIFITTDGRVKILDFGLAKLTSQKLAAGASSEIATQKAITDPGTVMGTVGYMSPEQVRGHQADHRSDIFSFGAILYEMLRGRRAFLGESAIEVMNAILKEEPEELTETNSKINPALERIVHRCLEKKPERRFQTASDLCFAIESLSMPSGSGASQSETWKALDSPITDSRHRGGRIAWIVAGVLAVALLALGIAYFNRSSQEPRAARLAFAPPEGLTFENGVYDFVVVSPDGQKLAFTAWSADGKKQIWVRSLNSSEAQRLPGTDDPQYPFWSPDSRSIGFGSRGKLKRIDLDSGRPQILSDAPDLRGGTWSRTGVILFQPRPDRTFLQIPATGGDAQAVIAPTPDQRVFRNPRFLPDGRHFLYGIGAGESAKGVFVGSLDSKEAKQLLADGTFADYAPPGWLIFERNGRLVAQSFDPHRLEVSGEASVLTPHASVTRPRFSVSENGVLVSQGDQYRDYQLVWFDREGRQVGAVGSPIKALVPQGPRLSPDGTRLAIARVDRPSENSDIWVIDLLRNLPTRLTSDPDYESSPVWSPDSNRIVFRGADNLYQKAANGTGTKETVLQVEGNQIGPRDWSSDGRFLIYAERAVKTNGDVWVLPLTGDRHPYPIMNSEFDERETQLSRDGHWLAYVSDESGDYEVYVQAFNADGKLGRNKVPVSTGGGNQPRWRRDGQELFYIAANGQMMAVAVKSNGSALEAGTPKALFKTRMFKEHNVPVFDYDVTADGQRFLIGTLAGEATPVSVILNWTAERKK